MNGTNERKACLTCSSSATDTSATTLHKIDLSKLKTFPLQRKQRQWWVHLPAQYLSTAMHVGHREKVREGDLTVQTVH